MFTDRQYLKYERSFWAMPNGWGDPNADVSLAKIWDNGGQGAVSILPVLGQFARSSVEVDRRLSKEELSRLAGVSSDAVATGAAALHKLGLVDHAACWSDGTYVTKWTLKPALVGPTDANGRYLKDSYSYIPTRLFYGGNWSRISGVQRALYLAVASQCDTYRSPPKEIEKLAHLSDRWIVDLERCFEHNPTDPWIRLASVSYATLSRISGVTRSALQAAVRDLMHPTISGENRNDIHSLQFSPLGVYPSHNGGNLIYHLRDHVPPWEWTALNIRTRRPDVAMIKRALEA